MLRASAAALVLVTVFGGGALAQTPRRGPADAAPDDYARDRITISTEGRSRTLMPTASCQVWANAEGLGVGPAQLGGMHGVSFTVVVNPVAGESPKAFAQGLAEAKATYPAAPDWLMRTLSANQAAIETACGQDHPEPFTIHRISRADTR